MDIINKGAKKKRGKVQPTGKICPRATGTDESRTLVAAERLALVLNAKQILLCKISIYRKSVSICITIITLKDKNSWLGKWAKAFRLSHFFTILYRDWEVDEGCVWCAAVHNLVINPCCAFEEMVQPLWQLSTKPVFLVAAITWRRSKSNQLMHLCAPGRCEIIPTITPRGSRRTKRSHSELFAPSLHLCFWQILTNHQIALSLSILNYYCKSLK